MVDSLRTESLDCARARSARHFVEALPDPLAPAFSLGEWGLVARVDCAGGLVRIVLNHGEGNCAGLGLTLLSVEGAVEEAGFGLPRIRAAERAIWTPALATAQVRAALGRMADLPPCRTGAVSQPGGRCAVCGAAFPR